MSGFVHAQSNSGSHLYLVHVEKFHQMELKIENAIGLSKAYDGPYVEAQFLVVPDSNSVYTFSTFQATHQYILERGKNQFRLIEYNLSQHQNVFVRWKLSKNMS